MKHVPIIRAHLYVYVLHGKSIYLFRFLDVKRNIGLADSHLTFWSLESPVTFFFRLVFQLANLMLV